MTSGGPVLIASSTRRNLDNRMETVVPGLDEEIRRELVAILDVYDRDNVTTWDMQPDGAYVRCRPSGDEAPRASQNVFIDAARQFAAEVPRYVA